MHGTIDLGRADILVAKQCLALQIRKLDQIIVDHDQPTDPSRSGILDCGRTDPARADHRDGGAAELRLAHTADLSQHDVASIALKFGVGQPHPPQS